MTSDDNDRPPRGSRALATSCDLYLPGHNVHWIQAKRSWGRQREDVAAVIESIDGDFVRVIVDGRVQVFRNHDLSRLAMLSAETPEVALRQPGLLASQNHLVCIAPADLPWIPCRTHSEADGDSLSLAEQLISTGGFTIAGPS